MGKPSDSYKVSLRERRITGQHNMWWVHTKHNTSVTLDQDTWYLCLPNSSPLSETQQQDGDIIRLWSCQVLFTLWVSCQLPCDPCQHWADPHTHHSPISQTVHVLVVVWFWWQLVWCISPNDASVAQLSLHCCLFVYIFQVFSANPPRYRVSALW